jgi:hypothetical protein
MRETGKSGVFGKFSSAFFASLALLIPGSSVVAGPQLVAPFRVYAWQAPKAQTQNTTTTVRYSPRSDPAAIARSLAALPRGQRVLLFQDHNFQMLSNSKDKVRTPSGQTLNHHGIWPETGTRELAAANARVFNAIRDQGVQINGLVMDVEHNWTNWSMSRDRLAAIQQDPRFAAISRDLGFSDLSRVANWRDPQNEFHFRRWNSMMNMRLDGYLRQAFTDPIRAAHPRALVSNYNDFNFNTADELRDLNGYHPFGEYTLIGSHASPALYGRVGNLRSVTLPNNATPNWLSPITQIGMSMNVTRAHQRISTTDQIPWIAPRSWTGDRRNTIPWANSDYYQEMVFQNLLSSGQTNVLFWNTLATPQDEQILDRTLGELRIMLGGELPLAPVLTEPVDLLASDLVSAVALADGLIVGRVTFGQFSRNASFMIGDQEITVTRSGNQLGQWFSVFMDPTSRGFASLIPEPSSAALTLAGLVGLLGRLRRN